MARGPPPGGPARLAVPWWTHGLPPKSGTVTAAAAQRIAVISSTGRHDFRAGLDGDDGRDARCPFQALGLAGRRGPRGPELVDNPVGRAADRAWAVGLADDGRPRFDAWLDHWVGIRKWTQ